eukprot:scaffold1940_cov112-Isochrysis_galbana.AAC.4
MSMEAQLQMRHNVEEMHSAFRDLTDWASDIESKDRALRGIEPKRTKRGGGVPPSGVLWLEPGHTSHPGGCPSSRARAAASAALMHSPPQAGTRRSWTRRRKRARLRRPRPSLRSWLSKSHGAAPSRRPTRR